METNSRKERTQAAWKKPLFLYVLPILAVSAFAFQNCSGGFEMAPLQDLASQGDNGGGGDGGGGGGGGAGGPGGVTDVIDPVTKTCTEASPIGKALIRKLNRSELNNSLNDILGLNKNYTADLSPDNADISGFTNNAETLQIDSDYMYTLEKVTYSAVNDALSKANSTYLQCANGQNLACAKTKLAQVGKAAFRRPLTNAEIDKLAAIFNKAISGGLSFAEGLGYSMQRIFMSPDFLYRSSYSGGETIKGVKLSQHELATRISYFLWNSAPDAQLLEAADNNKLGTAEEIRAQVKRLLMDAKADRFIRSFTDEWIGMQKLQAAARDGLSNQLKADMQEETERLMVSILRNDSSALDVIGADYSYINANLASLYGINGVTGTQFRRVEFSPMNIPRRGILTHGSILTLTSSPAETKPVARGAQILNGITCNPPPPFPDGLTVTPLKDEGAENLSVSERMALHRQEGTSCYGCHREMDPVGLALENFDQLGRYRTKYPSGNTVDSSGEIRGVKFSNGMQLIDFIVKQNDFKRCLTQKLMGYAIGRSITAQDKCAVQAIGDNYVKEDKTFSDLISAIVLSEQFLMNQTNSRGE